MGDPRETRSCSLSAGQQRTLLDIARNAVRDEAMGRGATPRNPPGDDPALTRPGACFVTLERRGNLRGCIGNLEPRLPLWLAVHENARAAAARDPRFEPVGPEELPELEIEISVLSEPVPLPYRSPDEVLQKLRPGRDGVILEVGEHRATFLPQVWEKVSGPAEFLDHLAYKACGRANAWRDADARFSVYTVECFGDAMEHGS